MPNHKKKTKAAQTGLADEAPTPEKKALHLRQKLQQQYFLVCSNTTTISSPLL